MTEENRRHNIVRELEKVDRATRRMQRMFAEEDFEGVMSAAYYYSLHCARALLLMEGEEAKFHGGVAHLISLHFVRTGRLAPELPSLLSHLFEDRQAADYDTAAVFTKGMAEDAMRNAGRIADAARSLLSSEGYL